MASRTNLGPSIRTRPCASDPPSRDAARSCFNRGLEAELINMSRDDLSSKLRMANSRIPRLDVR